MVLEVSSPPIDSRPERREAERARVTKIRKDKGLNTDLTSDDVAALEASLSMSIIFLPAFGSRLPDIHQSRNGALQAVDALPDGALAKTPTIADTRCRFRR